LPQQVLDKPPSTFYNTIVLAPARIPILEARMNNEDDKKDGQMKTVNEAARALSSLGAKMGGEARAVTLTPERRSEIARKAVQARWEKYKPDEALPRAAYGSPERPLKIGPLEIQAYVLDNEKRVLVQTGMINALGMSHGGSGAQTRTGKDRLAKFVSGKYINPFIPKELAARTENPIKFRLATGQIAYGYEATILADICDAVLEARKRGALQKQQEHIAAQCEILVRGFARVGIIALVDEATGFQDKRTKDALLRIMEEYIAKELRPWIKTFPDDYYKEIFRLNCWPFRAAGGKRPSVIGRWTNDVVYDRLAPGVRQALHELAERDENGRPKHKLFQRLTESSGHPKLREHLSAVVALMKASNSWGEFKKMIQRALPAYGSNLVLPLDDRQDKKED
jgi:hypothetical protein